MSHKAESLSTLTTTTTTQKKQRRLAWRDVLRRFLQRYTTAMSTSIHRDRLLKTAQYALYWLGVAMHSPAASKMSLELSWARYITRMAEWPMAVQGLLFDTWTPFLDPHNAHSPFSVWGRRLGRALAATMVLYYPAEHAAFGHWKVWPAKGGGTRVAEWYSAISCKAWLAYILVDLMQGYISLAQQRPAIKKDDDDDNNNNDHTAASQLAQAQAAAVRHKTRVVMLRNLLFALPAYHWSRTDWDIKPYFSQTIVNGCMVAEAVLSLYQTSIEVPAVQE